MKKEFGTAFVCLLAVIALAGCWWNYKRVEVRLIELTTINSKQADEIKSLQVEQAGMKRTITESEIEAGYWYLVYDFMKQRHPADAVKAETEVNKLFEITDCEN